MAVTRDNRSIQIAFGDAGEISGVVVRSVLHFRRRHHTCDYACENALGYHCPRGQGQGTF